MKKLNKKGFTLTELIVVIAVIAILAAVLIPALTGYISKARQSAFEQEAAGINAILEGYLTEAAADQLEDGETFADYYKEIAEEDLDDEITIEVAEDALTGKVTVTFKSSNTKLEAYPVEYSGVLAEELSDLYEVLGDGLFEVSQPAAPAA